MSSVLELRALEWWVGILVNGCCYDNTWTGLIGVGGVWFGTAQFAENRWEVKGHMGKMNLSGLRLGRSFGSKSK